MVFRFFPSLFVKPEKIAFAEQEVEETIELFLRQHPIVNLPWILLSLLGIVLPVIIIQADQTLGLNLTGGIPLRVFIGSLILYYLLILGYVVEKFLGWYFNIYIVTNIHIVDVDFDSLLYRSITELNLSDIESVASKIAGIWGSLYNFGDVIIETAAKTQAATFLKVPRPDFVADRIEDLRRQGGNGP